MEQTSMNRELRVLMLEDTVTDAELAERELRKAGIVFTALRVETQDAFERALAEFHPDIILSDYKLPNFNGMAALGIVQRDHPEVPVVMVTGALSDIEAVELIHAGAKDYVLKDRLARLAPAVQRALATEQSTRARQAAEKALRESEKKLRSSLLDSITALAAIVEMRDPYTSGHQRRVAQLAIAIARKMQLPDEQVEGIHLASVVHDVGKIRVPAEILSKPGLLSELEFALIKDHPRNGYEILNPIDFPWPIAQIVLQHHERLDGSGYPQGLKGDQIILEARILSVADVVEAMSSHRPYRAGLGMEAALAQISAQRGSHFDEKVVDACVALFHEQHYSLQEWGG
ncbi:MAG: HD domain-containing protein [Gallionella sp.]|jgi:putative two-component system response regulator|nr:HD domain-containing protein [Gallionella sp.]MCK9352553.1 HD domain-containing protein [Gallionella sp.]